MKIKLIFLLILLKQANGGWLSDFVYGCPKPKTLAYIDINKANCFFLMPFFSIKLELLFYFRLWVDGMSIKYLLVPFSKTMNA